MSSLTIGYLSMPMLIVLLLLRVPIGVALASIAFVGLAIIANFRVSFSSSPPCRSS